MLRRKVRRDDNVTLAAAAASSSSAAAAATSPTAVSSGSNEKSAAPLNSPPSYSSSAATTTTTTTTTTTSSSLPGSTPDSSSQASSSRPLQIPSRSISSSNSVTAMQPPLHHHPPPHHHQQQQQAPSSQPKYHQQQQQAESMPSSSIGRSQSTFNFLFSKAKASFTSSTNNTTSNQQQQQQQQQQQTQQYQQPQPSKAPNQSSPLNPSTSFSSVHTSGSSTFEEGGGSVGRSRGDVFIQGHNAGARSSTSDFNQNRYLQQGPSRLANGDEIIHTSSPTKRSLFGGNRERKASVNSVGKGNAALIGNSTGSTATDRNGWSPAPGNVGVPRTPFSQSPLGRGHRSDGPALNYGQFSKSHSDLHARGLGDFPSPIKKSTELPPMPIAPTNLIARVKSNDLLQSPVNNLGFSRSVDDLIRDTNADLRATSATPETAGTWGELGLAQDNWGRPSDIGTMANLRKDQLSPSGSLGQMGSGQVPFSSAPSYQVSPSLRNTAWPQESAILTSQHLAALPPPSLKKRPSSSPLASPQDSSQAIATVKQFAPGVDFEGFLNRNPNITLPHSQLSKGKEKDLSKGWKPYKVLMREGKLFFYKPTGSVADEIKALFPTSLVVTAAAADQQIGDVSIHLEDISRGKLGTQELLAATSRGTKDQAPPPRLSSKRPPQNDRLSAIVDDHEDESPIEVMSKSRKWERIGKHEELVLVEVEELPKEWWSRVQGGSIEALTHEYIFATQLDESASVHEEETYLYSALIATIRSDCSLQHFVQELRNWITTAINLSKSDEFFMKRDFISFRKRLEKRIQLLIESDIVNMVSDRPGMLATLEKLIVLTWKDDKSQAEVQLASVLGPEPSSFSRDHFDSHSDYNRSALRPSALLKLDPAEIARQIHIFTAQQYNSLQMPSSSVLRLLHREAEDILRMLSFDWFRPHFLTRLVLDHVLQFSSSPEANPQHSAKLRASLLRHWIAVASFLLKLDNVAAWLAICVALCSRSIARLSASWRFVASNDRALVAHVWAPILLEMNWSEASSNSTLIKPFLSTASSIKASMASRRDDGIRSASCRLPFLGNALVQVIPCSASTISSENLSLKESAPIALDILDLNKHWRSRDVGQERLKDGSGSNLEIQRTLYTLFQQNAESAEAFDASSKLKMSLQLEAPLLLSKVEVQAKSLFNKSLIACTQSPLVFPESLPSLSLLDKDNVERLIASSGSTIDQEQRSSTHAQRSPTNQLNAFAFDVDTTVTNRNPTRRPSLNASTFTKTRSRNVAMKEMPYTGSIEWASQNIASEENLIRIGIDLTLCAAPETLTSSMMIKRYSQDMGAKLSRPVSEISKRSSLPASNRSSMVETQPIVLQVVIKAGTLDRLVDILVMGVQHITLDPSDEVFERSFLSSTINKRCRLSIDLEMYRKAFLATYRSFCSPFTLFTLLQKRFLAAVDASREIDLPFQHRSAFPTWSNNEQMTNQNLSIDWDIVKRIRSGVISTIALWVTRYAQDFTEDDHLYKSIVSWIEELSLKPRLDEDDDWQRSLVWLGQVKCQLQLDVMTCCIRQVEKRALKRSSKRSSVRANHLDALTFSTAASNDTSRKATINFDEASPIELVDYLETVARVFFEKIEERDFQMASELFQSRSNDPMAWFIAKNSSSVLASQHPDEMPQVNNMYKLLELIRWPREGPNLSQRLPTSIRDACAAQNLLRGWIAIHIIEARIGVICRQSRIEKLLDAVWICRSRMLNSRGEDTMSLSWPPASAFTEPSIASFVECLIIGSLTSSESKLFTRAWQGVAAKRRGNCDNLVSLYPHAGLAETYAKATATICTPDIGWVLRTMAEAMTKCSIKSTMEGDTLLIDFDKYETIWTMIDSSVSYYNTSRNSVIDPDLVDLAGRRLSAMQDALRNVTWERRAFKEDAAYEANNASPLDLSHSSIMRGHRPLMEISTFQQDKHRRDRRALEVLDFVQHQRRSQQATAAAKANNKVNALAMANQVPQNRSYSSPPQTNAITPVASASEKKTRRMTALFRGAVRPMNLIGSSDKANNTNAEQITHTVAELLSSTPTQKPSLVIACGSSQIKIWNNHQRNFIFHLSTVEGGNFVLQATNEREAQDWIAAIEKASLEFALPISTTEASKRGGKRNPNMLPLYKSDLTLLVEQEKRPLPLGLIRMLEEVEARGLREQGIYRISGAKNAIDLLKNTFDKQAPETIDLSHGEFSDIHTIAGAIKQWYRDLPEPAVPFAFYHRIIEAEQISSEEDRLYAIRDLVWDFPKAHFELLRRTSQHLALVCDEGQYNLMLPHNIGLVFGTSLLNPPPGPSSVAESFGNIGKAAHIVKIIVTMHEWLFEPEPEGDGEGDGEGEIEAEAEGGAERDEENELGEDTVTYTRWAANGGGEEGEIAAPSSDMTRQESVSNVGSEASILPASASSEVKSSIRGREAGTSITSTKSNQKINSFGRRLGAPPTRDRGGIESVYLDATEAIAALQDPFEEEEEEEEGEEEEVVEVEK